MATLSARRLCSRQAALGRLALCSAGETCRVRSWLSARACELVCAGILWAAPTCAFKPDARCRRNSAHDDNSSLSLSHSNPPAERLYRPAISSWPLATWALRPTFAPLRGPRAEAATRAPGRRAGSPGRPLELALAGGRRATWAAQTGRPLLFAALRSFSSQTGHFLMMRARPLWSSRSCVRLLVRYRLMCVCVRVRMLQPIESGQSRSLA